MVKRIKSPALSLKGWSAWEWFKGNWTTIKEVGKLLIPLGLGTLATSNPALLGIITVIGKALLDVLQYFIKEY